MILLIILLLTGWLTKINHKSVGLFYNYGRIFDFKKEIKPYLTNCKLYKNIFLYIFGMYHAYC